MLQIAVAVGLVAASLLVFVIGAAFGWHLALFAMSLRHPKEGPSAK